MATCATLPATRAFRANLERQKVNDSPDGQDNRFFAAFSLLRRHRSAYRLFAYTQEVPIEFRFWSFLGDFGAFFPALFFTHRTKSPQDLSPEVHSSSRGSWHLCGHFLDLKKIYFVFFGKSPEAKDTERESVER